MSRVIVYHGGYGCDTGCCGHYVDLDDDTSNMSFDHPEPGESDEDFIKRLVTEKFGEEHVADIDWENCQVWDGC